MRDINFEGFTSPFTRVFHAVLNWPLTDLFADGSVGKLQIDNGDNMFSDIYGTTPAGYGDPVMLQLDTSKGAGFNGSEFTGLGLETVDFDSLTDQGTGWVFEDGTIKKVDDDTIVYDLGATVLADRFYAITYTKQNHTVGSPTIIVGDNNYDGVIQSSQPVGTYTVVLKATNDGSVTISGRFSRIEFTAFSVRELPGHHDTQPTLANAPIKTRWPKSGKRNDKLINTAVLATQSVTVTAVERTLSFVGTGTVTLSGASTAGPLIGTGSNRVSLTFTPSAGSLTLTVTGDVRLAQLELGDTVTPTQVVGASQFDVTEEGQRDCVGLYYGGASDPRWSVTPPIDFTGTDKVTVIAGVTKLSDENSGNVVELSASVSVNGASFLLRAPQGTGPNYNWFSTGNGSLADAKSNSFPAPTTNLLTGVADITGDLATLKVDGGQAAQSTVDQGTGNYGNYPLYTGARGGSSLFFNGYIWGTLIVGKTLDPATLAKAEAQIAANTPEVTL